MMILLTMKLALYRWKLPLENKDLTNITSNHYQLTIAAEIITNVNAKKKE